MNMRTVVITSVVIFLFIVTMVCVHTILLNKQSKPRIGMTYSVTYAEFLGVNPREAFLHSLDELSIEAIRLPLYWNRIETEKGVYDFSEMNWYMDEAAKRGVKVTLVTGVKVPRWPECYMPNWIDKNNREDVYTNAMEFVRVSVEQYRTHPALERWQVENEPFFNFGHCPPPDPQRVYAEIDLVKELDPHHPIQRTTSGEQSIWPLHTKDAGVLGVSLYRAVWNSVTGHFIFPLPPFVYTFQGWLSAPFVSKVIVSELQMEPWFEHGAFERPIEELANRFTERHLLNNYRYAIATGFPEIYVWGVEWWYHLKQNGHPTLWDTAVSLFGERQQAYDK